MQIAAPTERKQDLLQSQLRALPSVIVAFSGGADSAYLAWVAHETLADCALAVTAVSASLPQSERQGVEDFVRRFGLRHEFISTDELANPDYVANRFDRCYFCKDELFTKLDALARDRKSTRLNSSHIQKSRMPSSA